MHLKRMYTMLGVPTVAQWVKNSPAVTQVTEEIQFWSLAHCSGLRIQHCYSCGIGCSCISHSISGLGTSICCRCGQKKKKRMYIIILYRYIMLVLTGIRYTLQIRSSWLIVFKFSIWLFIFHFPILYFLYITPKVKVIKEDRFHLK